MTAEAPIIPASTEISGGPPTTQAFKDIFNTPQDAPLKEIKKPQEGRKAPETGSEGSKGSGSDKVAKEGKSSQNASEGDQKDDKAASRKWEKLGEIKKPEDEEEIVEGSKEDLKGERTEKSQSTEKKGSESDDEEGMPDGKAQSRWMELKSTESAAKKSQSIDDILKIPALSEKAKESITSLKKELEDIKVKGFIPEEVKTKLDGLEQRYAEELLEHDPKFKQEVLYPIAKSWTTLGDVAKEAGLSATAAQALENAVRDMSEVARSRAIRKIISTGKQMEGEEEQPLSDEDISTLSTLAISAANNLHNEHWPREFHYRREAKEIADARKGKEVEETAAQRVAREDEWKKEGDRIDTVLSEKLKPIFDEFPDALEAIKSAKASTELADQVYDAKASHALFYATQTINSLKSKLAKAEASLKAREAAKPRGSDGAAIKPKGETEQISFAEAFGRR